MIRKARNYLIFNRAVLLLRNKSIDVMTWTVDKSRWVSFISSFIILRQDFRISTQSGMTSPSIL